MLAAGAVGADAAMLWGLLPPAISSRDTARLAEVVPLPACHHHPALASLPWLVPSPPACCEGGLSGLWVMSSSSGSSPPHSLTMPLGRPHVSPEMSLGGLREPHMGGGHLGAIQGE